MSEGKSIADELKKLVQLQKIDSRIYHLTKQKRSLPSKKEELDVELNSKKSAFQQADEELKRLTVQKSEKETEMAGKEEKIKKHEGDLFQIKNNKEYSALRREIDSIKADVSLLEDAILTLYDQIEMARAKLEEEKRKFEQEEVLAKEEKDKLDRLDKQINEELAGANAERSEQVKDIEPDLLDRYQRILDNRGEKAMAVVRDEFCGHCNMRLRPQVINACHIRRALVICESCGRILYAEV